MLREARENQQYVHSKVINSSTCPKRGKRVEADRIGPRKRRKQRRTRAQRGAARASELENKEGAIQKVCYGAG